MGVSVADYNNVGRPDLYITAYGGSRLFRNQGDGTFTDVTRSAGIADLSSEFVWPLTAAVCERAARVRATHGFRPLDALHLAAAVEHGCGLFLINDAQLVRFPDIPVEVLT